MASSWAGRCRGESGAVRKYARTQEHKSSSSVHLAFDHLEAIDLSLGLPIAPAIVYSGGDGRDVFLQPVGEAHNGPELASLGFFNLLP